MTLTQCHSYYVNVLCFRLWQQSATPAVEEIIKTWRKYVDEEQYRIAAEISTLSPNQRAILRGLAFSPTNEPTGKEFSHFVRLSITSISQAVKILLEKDLLYKDNQGLLKILDPAIDTLLKEHY